MPPLEEVQLDRDKQYAYTPICLSTEIRQPTGTSQARNLYYSSIPSWVTTLTIKSFARNYRCNAAETMLLHGPILLSSHHNRIRYAAGSVFRLLVYCTIQNIGLELRQSKSHPIVALYWLLDWTAAFNFSYEALYPFSREFRNRFASATLATSPPIIHGCGLELNKDQH